MEYLRDNLWKKLSNENDELVRLSALNDVDDCIYVCKDKISQLMKSYAVVTQEISRICLDCVNGARVEDRL